MHAPARSPTIWRARRSSRTRPTQAIAGYEKKLADARTNAQSIAGQTRDKLMAEADARRKTLEASLADHLHEAEKTIVQTKTAGDVECARHRKSKQRRPSSNG